MRARLASGTQRFAQANQYHFLVPVIGCGILATLAGLAYAWRRRKRDMTPREDTMDRQGATIMRGRSVSTPALILVLATGLPAGGNAAVEQPRQPPAGGSLNPASCPTPAAIGTTIGFPVKPVHQLRDRCMYELSGEYRGAFVTVTSQPATRANDVYAEIRQQVKGIKGVNAKPDPVKLGEGGWGYASMGKKEAATVSQGTLYHVELDYDLFESLALREDAAVRVLDLAIRSAPAGKTAAAFDACMLATNAEVSQIAEEKPEMAKYWSAPATAMGGAHCDYDGASIQVYQGKTPAAALDATLKTFKADRQPRVPVAGLGDKAFFMIPMPDNKYNRLGLLAVYAGPQVLQLTLDAQGDEPIEATRPRLERLARLVLPRLR